MAIAGEIAASTGERLSADTASRPVEAAPREHDQRSSPGLAWRCGNDRQFTAELAAAALAADSGYEVAIGRHDERWE
jgi:hypothetical protein